jgi:hypothetical protein
MEKFSKFLTWPLVALLLGGGVLFALIAIFAPPDVRELLFGANGLAMAVIGYLMRSPRERALGPELEIGPRPWERPGFHEEDPTPAMTPRAIERRDRLPGDSQRPPRRAGSSSLAALVAMAFGGVIALALLVSGCGSAIQTQARAATIAAVATTGAARVVSETAAHEARTTCPHETYAPGSLEMSACLAPVRARWAPADGAIASVRATLAAWIEALEVARLAGDGADLWEPLAIAAARLVREYDALVDVLAAVGVHLPALPSFVVEATDLVGGE